MSEGTLDPGGLAGILKRVAADRAFWTLVEVGNEVLAAAEALAARILLRALDAIHSRRRRCSQDERLPRCHLRQRRPRQTAAASTLGMSARLIPS